MDSLVDEANTQLFHAVVNDAGAIMGGIRAKGPLDSPEESHAIVEWENRTLPCVQDNRRATDLWQQIVHVGLYESSKQRNCVANRSRQTKQVVERSSLLGYRIRNMK